MSERPEQTGTQNQAELLLAVGELKGTVKTGFETIQISFNQVNSHLAMLNGKVAAHEKKLNTDEGEKKGVRISFGRFIGIVSLVSIILGIVLSITNLFFKK